MKYLCIVVVLMGCRQVPKVEESKLSCKDWDWWYSSEKKEFNFEVINERNQSTTIVFDTLNIREGDNREFVRYYFFKDIRIDSNISYTITTDTVFNNQVTHIFKLKIDGFHPKPNLSL